MVARIILPDPENVNANPTNANFPLILLSYLGIQWVCEVPVVGTYTTNRDCTGTFTLQVSPLGVTVHVYFVLADSGNEFQAIETDPGLVITHVARAQFAVGDPRR